MIKTVLGDFWRFVLFRPLRGNVKEHYNLYLLVGLATTWIVGIGRTWDNPYVVTWLRSGLPSVAYAFALAAFIWMIVAALRPARWTFRNVLLMVTMTALPGIIYAAPVEMVLPPGMARSVNMIFLLIVAIWRMALYYRFLRETAQLPGVAGVVAFLLPPTLIVAFVSAFGLLSLVASSMGGVRDPSPAETITEYVLTALMFASWAALPVLFVLFLAQVVQRWPRSATPGDS